MKVEVESREDLEKAMQLFDVEIIDEKEVDDYGRINLGTDRSGQNLKLAILDFQEM